MQCLKGQLCWLSSFPCGGKHFENSHFNNDNIVSGGVSNLQHTAAKMNTG